MTFIAVAGVSADATADVNVKVSQPDNRVVSASITGGRFQDVKYRAGTSKQNSTAVIVVTATDTRGVGSARTLSLSADVEMGSVYAGTATQLQFVLQQPLPAGR